MDQITGILISLAVFGGSWIVVTVYRQIRDVFPNRWRAQQYRQRNSDEYHRSLPWAVWFAWRPVRTVSGNIVWWCMIYRQLGNTYVDHDDWRWFHYGTFFDIIADDE